LGPRHDVFEEQIMPVLTDTLKLWLTGFRAVKAACAQVDTSARTMTQNDFGNRAINSLLPNPGNVVTFIGNANAQFNAAELGWKLRPPINTTQNFIGLMTFPLWHPLSYCVQLYIQSCVPAGCITSKGDLILTTPLATAFPLGPNDPGWTKLMSGVSTLSLDSVLAANAFANAAQLIAPGSASRLSDLVSMLSTI
jgi:hypothetical protein